MPLDKRKTDNELSYGSNLLEKIPDRWVVKSYRVTSTDTGYEKVIIVSCTPSTMRTCLGSSPSRVGKNSMKKGLSTREI